MSEGRPGAGIAGVDEAGRGPWAGPVVAAAVVLAGPIDGLTDSKRLSAAARERLAATIRAEAQAWALGRAEVAEIDAVNIREATFRAMRRALDGVAASAAAARIDGREVPPGLACPAEAVIRGDASEPAIAAASILAKTVRDAEMAALDAAYPGYGLARHKGYGTAAHREALARYGPSPVHRRSFAPVRRCLAGGEPRQD